MYVENLNSDGIDPETMDEVKDCAVEAGLMLEFINPRNGDTYLIPTTKMTMELGYTRQEARQYVMDRIHEFNAAGFRRVDNHE